MATSRSTLDMGTATLPLDAKSAITRPVAELSSKTRSDSFVSNASAPMLQMKLQEGVRKAQWEFSADLIMSWQMLDEKLKALQQCAA